MLKPNLVKLGHVVLEKKILTDDARRTPSTHDDRRQHIAVDHLGDSGDLKIDLFRAVFATPTT